MLQNRPPIVVILGHVDHGKTTLLDYLRHSNIVAREAGGITQSIRSFQLSTPNCPTTTFIDTPGHQAFAAMRSRGSLIADLAVLVVAADDGVKPQTKESMDFIKSAGIPFLVAITKSDLPTANSDKVKTDLTELGIVVEDLGGDIPALTISAKTGAGISDLLETISLMSQLHPPQADPDGDFQAVVLESRLDSQKGPLASVIVKNGTLTVGDKLPFGKVRAIIDSEGRQIKSALPSQPVDILGLNVVLDVGSIISMSSTAEPTTPKPSSEKPQPAGLVNLIIRADVAGSLEAILSAIPTDFNVISSGTGDFTESDVDLAKTGQAVMVGFNVRVTTSVSKLAEVEKISIHTYKIIYELLDSIQKLLTPVSIEEVKGKAQIIAEFKINSERIAGCKSSEGILAKSDKIRLVRGEQTMGESRIKSLKSGKSDVSSVKSGIEFGAVFGPYIDFKVGDIIIAHK